MRRYILIIILFFLYLNSFAQINLDSLQTVLRTTNQDTTKLNVYVELFSYYTFKNIDSTFFYLDLAKELESKNNIKHVKAKIFNTEGNVGWWQGDLELARKKYFEAINIWEELGKNKKINALYYNIALSFQYEQDSALFYLAKCKKYALEAQDSLGYIRAISREGDIFVNRTNYKEALVIYEDVLNYGIKNNITSYQLQGYYGLALINFRTKNYRKALGYYQKEYDIAKEGNDIYELNAASTGLALVYYKLNKIKESEKYHHEGLAYARQIGNPRMVAVSLSNIYEQFTEEGRYKEAAPYIEEALELSEEYNLEDLFMSLYINYGKSEMYNKNYGTARKYVKKGINIAYSENSYPWLAYGYRSLVRIDSLRGDYKSALKYKDSLIKFEDSLKSIELNEKIEELNIKYETEQKEQENIILKKEFVANRTIIKNRNIIIIAVSGVAILALVLFFVILINRKRLSIRNLEISMQKEEIELQAEELKSNLDKITELTDFKDEVTQMLVHDLKNPLNVLMNIPKNINTEEKEEIRKNLEYQMLNLVMNILDVKKYAEAELKIYPVKLSLSLIIEKVINLQNFVIKQKNITISHIKLFDFSVKADEELVERIFSNIFINAIKYTPNNGKIKISYEQIHNNFVKIIIEDSGSAIPAEDLKNIFEKYKQTGTKIKYSTGLGLTFCKIAVEKHRGKIHIEANKNNGTTVWFTLPIYEIEEIQQTTPITKTEVILTQKEKEELTEILSKLENIDISEITTLRKIFKTIETQKLGNENWREALKNAVYTANETEFKNLLKK